MLTSTLAGRAYRPDSSLPPVKVTVDPNIRKDADGNILVTEPGVQIGDVFIADPTDTLLAVGPTNIGFNQGENKDFAAGNTISASIPNIKLNPSTGQGSIKTGQLTTPVISAVGPTISTGKP